MTKLLCRLARIGLFTTAGILTSTGVFAQLPTIATATRDTALAAVQKEFAGQLAAASTDDEKKAIYRQMFEALIRNEGLYPKRSAAEYP